MSERLNNGYSNMDDYLRNMLNNHQAEPSPNIWAKFKVKLFKQDVSEFVRFKKFRKAYNPHYKSVSLQVKLWASYATAAILTVGFVFGSTYLISSYIKESPAYRDKEITLTPLNSINKKSTENKTDSGQTHVNSYIPSENIKPDKQNITLLSNNSNTAEKNDTKNPPINNKNSIDKAEPIVSNNINTLMNYIQRQNPEKKITTPEKSNEIQEEVVLNEKNIIPFSNDTFEVQSSVPDYKIEIPNIITPNGDGFNDVLIIKNLDKFLDHSLIIADRSGKVVFETNSYQNDWDAKNLTDGTYYYILSYKDNNNFKGIIKGLITIIRQ